MHKQAKDSKRQLSEVAVPSMSSTDAIGRQAIKIKRHSVSGAINNRTRLAVLRLIANLIFRRLLGRLQSKQMASGRSFRC